MSKNFTIAIKISNLVIVEHIIYYRNVKNVMRFLLEYKFLKTI